MSVQKAANVLEAEHRRRYRSVGDGTSRAKMLLLSGESRAPDEERDDDEEDAVAQGLIELGLDEQL